MIDRYVALTLFTKRKYVEAGFDAGKIDVVPNFLLEDPGVGPHDGAFFLYVGRLVEEKGVATLLDAWGRKGLGVTLRMVGVGPLARTVREASAHCPFVTHEGGLPHDEVLARLKAAKALVLPSTWYEGMPRVLIEAFACGTPVIASRLGTMEEIIEDGRTGLLFEPGSAEELASKVKWAASHPERLREMGFEARREYERSYTAERNYQLLMDVYRRALVERAGT